MIKNCNLLNPVIPASKFEIIAKETAYITEADKEKLLEIAKKMQALFAAHEKPNVVVAAELTKFFDEEREVWKTIQERYIKDRGSQGLLLDAKAIIAAMDKEDYLRWVKGLQDRQDRETEPFKYSYYYLRLCSYVQIRGIGEEKIRPLIEDRIAEWGYPKPKGLYIPPIHPDGIQEAKNFYNVPTSPAIDLFLETLGAGENIADLPYRKAAINHGALIEVLENKEKREITAQTVKSELKIELTDIEKLAGSNKAAKKLFVLSLIKANEQAIHNGQLSRDYVSFPLQELVDIGLYKSLRSARKGFNAGADILTSIKVAGKTRKTNKKEIAQDSLRVPFTGSDIIDGQCYIYLNERINWAFIIQYFTLLPRYYFKLSNRGSDLLFYIFYLARQNTKRIAEQGYFTISFRAIQHRLQLPNEEGLNNPQRDIKDVIDNAIEQIETEHNNTYGNMEFSLLPVYEEGSPIAQYLDNGYLRVELKGEFATGFIAISKGAEKKQIEAQRKQARVQEKAIAQVIADNIKNKEKTKE